MTETEPEWDDRERLKMLALGKFEAGLCECGWHEDLTGDPDNHFTFVERVCPVCRGSAQQTRMQHAADEAFDKTLGDKPPPGAPRPADGRRTAVRLMGPDEVAERRQGRRRHS